MSQTKTILASSGAALCSREGDSFIFDTGKVTKTVTLDAAGRFYSEGVSCSGNGQTWFTPGHDTVSDEFFFTVEGKKWEGRSGGWTITDVTTSTRSQGELEVAISLEQGGITVIRHYVLYPGQPTIGEFTAFRNDTGRDLTITRPSLFVYRQAYREKVDFSYMTGGANFTGSLIYKTFPYEPGYLKEFDSNSKPEVIEVEGQTINDQHPVNNGTGMWCEFFTFGDQQNPGGLFLTFDYQGWWKARSTCADDAQLLTGWCELLDYPFPAGETLTMANTTAGIWQGDMDDLGNTIAEYIYTYKWDATNPNYFAVAGATIWREAPLTEKVYRMVQASRYIGLDHIHVDDFWFDAKGNWNGIFGDDWTHNHAFMTKHDISFRLWMPPWHADRLSQVWLEHPDWRCGWHGNWYNWTLDMSKEEVYQWILNMLCEKQKEFGTYMLRVDGNPCSVKNDGSFTTSGGAYNDTFKQSENFYRLYREFKEKNPEAGLNACSSGGHTLTIEATRYAESQQITDGWCLHNGTYYASLFCPIDKISGFPNGGALMQDPDTKPMTAQELEEHRKACLLFKWARREGLVGRWIKVFRPELEHGDKTYLLQRLTWDGKRGYLTLGGSDANPILGKPARIFPKGLNPEERYLIESMKGSMAAAEKTGAQWMSEGIALDKAIGGDILLFNWQGRPGTSGDTSVPTVPGKPETCKETWMGHEGIGVTWAPSEDEYMMGYYEIEKNGEILTKVSNGTYFFDEDGDGSAKYRVRAVDAEGNASAWAE